MAFRHPVHFLRRSRWRGVPQNQHGRTPPVMWRERSWWGIAEECIWPWELSRGLDSIVWEQDVVGITIRARRGIGYLLNFHDSYSLELYWTSTSRSFSVFPIGIKEGSDEEDDEEESEGREEVDTEGESCFGSASTVGIAGGTTLRSWEGEATHSTGIWKWGAQRRGCGYCRHGVGIREWFISVPNLQGPQNYSGACLRQITTQPRCIIILSTWATAWQLDKRVQSM